jgi:hypothetical protein
VNATNPALKARVIFAWGTAPRLLIFDFMAELAEDPTSWAV